jgi:hypothetical protein
LLTTSCVSLYSVVVWNIQSGNSSILTKVITLCRQIYWSTSFHFQMTSSKKDLNMLSCWDFWIN